jgi:rRNA-processing protein FCF1
VPSTVVQELEGIKRKNSKTNREVEFTKKLISQCNILETSLGKGETVDDLIIRTAKNINAVVATTDMGLKKRLREQNIPIIYLRQRKKLELEGSILYAHFRS